MESTKSSQRKPKDSDTTKPEGHLRNVGPGLYPGLFMQDRPTKRSASPPEPPAPTLVKSPPGRKRAAQAVTETQHSKLYRVSGMVQGVGYRYFAQRIAAQLGITGYAKNLSDGRVEVFAIGNPEALESFSKSLKRGPKFAEVTGVEVQDRPIDERYAKSFSIEHDW